MKQKQGKEAFLKRLCDREAAELSKDLKYIIPCPPEMAKITRIADESVSMPRIYFEYGGDHYFIKLCDFRSSGGEEDDFILFKRDLHKKTGNPCNIHKVKELSCFYMYGDYLFGAVATRNRFLQNAILNIFLQKYSLVDILLKETENAK